MYIWLVTRPDVADYDQFEGFVCFAKTEHDARHTWPIEWLKYTWNGTNWVDEIDHSFYSDMWIAPKDALVKCIGVATAEMVPGVILTDFKAG